MSFPTPKDVARRAIALTLALLLAAFPVTQVFAVETEKPQTLPKVSVSADVPLTKVAEYQMCERRFAPAAVADQDYIYIIGGLVADGTTTDSVERFDLRTGKSEIIAHLRVARLWHRAVLVGRKIYVLGGSVIGGAHPEFLTDVAQASSSGRRTTKMIPIPSAQGGTELESSVEIFDLGTGRISRGPAMLEPRHQFACFELGGKIYVMGGGRIYRGKYSFTNTTEILDLATNQWRAGIPMPSAEATDAALVDGGFVVVAGGYNGLRSSAAVAAFDPRDGTWRSLAPLCRSTSAHTMVFLGHSLFLFGDYGEPERLLAYDLKTKQSEQFTLRYTPARHTATVVADGQIYVIGGRRERQSASLDTIQVFAPTAKASPKS